MVAHKRRKAPLGLTARCVRPQQCTNDDVERETYAEALADPRLDQRSSQSTVLTSVCGSALISAQRYWRVQSAAEMGVDSPTEGALDVD
jgi:hypothetical protein